MAFGAQTAVALLLTQILDTLHISQAVREWTGNIPRSWQPVRTVGRQLIWVTASTTTVSGCAVVV